MERSNLGLVAALLFVGACVASGEDPTADPRCQGSPASFQAHETREQLLTLLIGKWQRCKAAFTNDPRQLRVTFTPVESRYVPLQ
jgi:hypothetical protein